MHLCTTVILLLILPKCFAISVIQSRAGFALKSRECNQAVVKHTKLPNHAYRVECLCGSIEILVFAMQINKNIDEVKSTILLLSALYYYILFGRETISNTFHAYSLGQINYRIAFIWVSSFGFARTRKSTCCNRKAIP